jgi:hypothetical protein
MDKFIVRTNINQFEKTGKFDVVHASQLSTDAEPERSEVTNRLSAEDQALLKEDLRTQLETLQKDNSHWQSSNWSRSRGQSYLEELLK